MLWLCFAANLSLSLAADPIGKESAPSSTGSIVVSNSINNNNHNNNNNNNNSSTGGSGNNKHEKKEKDANMNRVTGMRTVSESDEERSQQRNWINSNLSKTSQLTSIEVEEMRQKLNQARKELRNINKELRDSYANYDYLEVSTGTGGWREGEGKHLNPARSHSG